MDRDDTQRRDQNVTLTEALARASETSRTFFNKNGVAYIEDATRYAEFGRFQILLFLVCAITFANTAVFPNILRNHVQAVQCDYNLTLKHRRAINDIVYVCMITGGVSWSMVADTLSRKWSLIAALICYLAATMGFILTDSHFHIGMFRGISSFCSSAISSITIPFVAEFQISYSRGSMICCLQLAWLAGMLIIPSLPFDWKSLIIISVFPIIISIIGLLFFPDSPRFLLSRGREKEALSSLNRIYAFNTGYQTSFPIHGLRENRTADQLRYLSVVKPYIPRYLEPRVACIPVLMSLAFVVMLSYYTLALWFPQLISRMDMFFPIIRVDSIPQDCKIGPMKSTTYKASNKTIGYNKYAHFSDDLNVTDPSSMSLFNYITSKGIDMACYFDDQPKINLQTNILIALACMPSLIWLVVKVDSLGRKYFLTFSQVVAGCLVFVSYYMHNSDRELLFCCLFDSVTLISLAVCQCFAVELFPSRVRVFGVALVLGAGQLGAILGDIDVAVSFGLTCVSVIALIALGLATTAVLIMVLPETTGIPLT